MSSKPAAKSAMRVETNLRDDQELRLNPVALINFLKPEIEKFLAEKKQVQDASTVTNTRD